MATYYKYAERDADSQINWAEIGKSMSDMLKEQNRIREEKKAAIDQASQEYGEKLSNPPQGEFKAMNQWTLEYADDYQKYRLMQDKLLKSGQLKMKDYMVMRQNSLDGTNQLFNLSTQYQQVYKEKMDRSEKQENQDLELFLMQQAEGLANFMDHKAYINPTDGTVSIAKMVTGEDGIKRMSDNPNEFISVTALGNSIKDNYDKFKSTEAVAGYVDRLGERLTTLLDIKNKYQRGSVIEILDPMQNEDLPPDVKGIARGFEQAETDMLNSFLTIPTNVTSILTEDVNIDPKTNKEYTYTWSEEEAGKNSNLILLKNNNAGRPEPQLTEEQRAVALDHLRVKARLMYDKKETANVVGASETPQPRSKTQAEVDADNAKLTKQSMLQDWQLVRNGTNEQKQAALDAILGYQKMIDANLRDIRIENNKVILDYEDPSKYREIDISQDADAFFRQGREIFGDTTQEELNKYAVGDYIAPTKNLVSSRGKTPTDYKPYLKSDMNKDQNLVTEDDAEATAAHLNATYGQFGINVTSPSSKVITIEGYLGGKPKSASFDISDMDRVRDIKNFIAILSNNKELEKKYKPKVEATNKSTKGKGDDILKGG